MFGHGIFKFDIVRKMTIYFATLFNDISISRVDSSNNTTQVIRVPLVYSQKNKMLVRTDDDPEIQKEASLVLPRMGFELTGLNYDGGRKLPTINKVVVKDTTDANKLKRQFNPVPYNLEYNLYVAAKNISDSTQIIEQILPFFTPDWTAEVSMVPEMSIVMDIPIVLRDVSPEIITDGNLDTTGSIIWTLAFTIKTYFYGPVVSKPIVKFANTRFLVPGADTPSSNIAANQVGNTDILGTVVVKPGLDANGDPTTNAAVSVNTSIIYVDDDWGYIVTPSGIIINE